MRYIIIAFVLSGCATHGVLVSGQSKAWINISGPNDSDKLYYCMANEKDTIAEPACFEPKKVNHH